MCKYRRSEIGLLNRRYRSVLKKCLLINCGLLLVSSPVQAEVLPVLGDSSVVEYQLGSEDDYTFKLIENGVTTYYKINILTDLLDSNHILWDKVASAGENTIGITLPHNGTGTETMYLKYSYDGSEWGASVSNFKDNTVRAAATASSYTPDNPFPLTGITDTQKKVLSGLYTYDNKVYEGNYVTPIVRQNRSGGTIYAALYGTALSNVVNPNNETDLHKDLGDLTADFINNYVDAVSTNLSSTGAVVKVGSSSNLYIYGGAAGNPGAITVPSGGDLITSDPSSIQSLTGEFIGNYITGTAIVADDDTATSLLGAYGGALGNRGIIGTITGSFINNYIDVTATGDGATAYGFGGAVYNHGTITTLNANFLSNYADHGGAIYNDGEITTLSGNFIGNRATNGNGGAIHGAGFENINGDFISNEANGNGGAISVEAENGGIIENLRGEFIANQALDGNGGALFIGNQSGVEQVTGNFIGNIANSDGGAIYIEDTDEATNIVADTADVLFSNNTANDRYNDIYLKDVENFGLNAASNHTITFNGTIEGETTSDTVFANINRGSSNTGGTYAFNNEVSGLGLRVYNGAQIKLGVHEQSDGTTTDGYLNLESFENDAQGGEIDAINGVYRTQILGSNVKLLSDLDYKIDILVENNLVTISDMIQIASTDQDSVGSINLTDILFAGASEGEALYFEGKKQIINNTGSNAVTLKLAQEYTATAESLVTDKLSIDSKDINWDTGVYLYDERTVDSKKLVAVEGESGIVDSIEWVDNGSLSPTEENIRNYDALVFLHQTDMFGTNEKTFTDNSTGTYNLTENLGETYGSLSVIGQGADASTLNMNGHQGFEIGDGATVKLDGISVNSNKAVTLAEVSEGGLLKLNNVEIASPKLFITNDENLELSGSNTLNGMIDGEGTTTVTGGETTLNADIIQDNLIIADGTLITNADNLEIANDIQNDGTLTLTGGNLSQGVTKATTGEGEVTLENNVVLANGGSISDNKLDLKDHKLSVENTGDNVLDLSEFKNEAGAELDTQNGATQNLNLGQALIDNLEYALDVDLSGDGTADTLTVADNSSGTVKITSLNFLNPTAPNKEFEINVINGSGVTLELDRAITASMYAIGTTSESKADTIAANTLYNPEGNYFEYVRQGDVLGKIDLTEDQTGIKLEANDVIWGTWEKGDPLGDTMMLVNTDETNSVKTFNFATPDDNYQISDNLGATKGDLAVNGVSSDNGKSTLDLNGHSGFEVDENASLTIRNTNVIGQNAIVSSGEVTLDNTDVETVTNDGTLNIANNTTFDEISGTGETNITSDLDLGDGKISGNTVNATNGTVKVGSNNLDQDVVLNAKNGSTIEIANNTVNIKEANFDQGSALSLKVNSLSDYGSLIANTINVEQNATLKATLAQGLMEEGQEATIQLLVADNDDFNNFTDQFENNMYSFEKDGTNGAYKVRKIKTADDVAKEYGGTRTNQEAAKAYIEGDRFPDGASGEIADGLADLAQNDAKGLLKALTALAPNDSPVLQGVVSYQDDILFRTVAQHLRQAKDDNVLLQSLTDGLSLWVRTYMGTSKLNDHAGIYGFDMDSKGIIAALEKKLTSVLKAGLGYHYDKADVSAYSRDVDVEMNKIFAYAEYKPSQLFMHATAGYGMSDYKEDKMALGNTYKAKYDVDTFSMQALVGYEQDYITPEAGLRYYHIKRRGYNDSAMQKVSSKDMNVLAAVAGLRAGKDYTLPSGYTLRPEAYIGVVYDIVSDRDNAIVNLANGSSYMVHGQNLNKFGVELGAGLTAKLMDSLSLNVSYMGGFRRDYRNHTGMIGLRYDF